MNLTCFSFILCFPPSAPCPCAKAKISKQDKYAAQEQLAMAALDLNDASTARRVVDQLYAVFPKSVRVGKLEGMCMEAGWAVSSHHHHNYNSSVLSRFKPV